MIQALCFFMLELGRLHFFFREMVGYSSVGRLAHRAAEVDCVLIDLLAENRVFFTQFVIANHTFMSHVADTSYIYFVRDEFSLLVTPLSSYLKRLFDDQNRHV